MKQYNEIDHRDIEIDVWAEPVGMGCHGVSRGEAAHLIAHISLKQKEWAAEQVRIISTYISEHAS